MIGNKGDEPDDMDIVMAGDPKDGGNEIVLRDEYHGVENCEYQGVELH